MNIYVASSWRNDRYRMVIDELRNVLKLSPTDHHVYDFQHEGKAFDWKDIDPDWDSHKDIQLSSHIIVKLLDHPLAKEAFNADFDALENADLLLLVLPCGKSAHIEAGAAFGMDIPVFILLDEQARPELTYRIASYQSTSLDDIIAEIAVRGRHGRIPLPSHDRVRVRYSPRP